MHGPLGIVLMRGGIPKIDQVHRPDIGQYGPRSADDLRGGGLIGAYHLAEIFGVETAREVGRADQVAEQHGELPPFRVWRAADHRRGENGHVVGRVCHAVVHGEGRHAVQRGGGLGGARGSQAAAATDEGGPRTAPGLGRAQGCGAATAGGVSAPVQTSPWPASSRAS